MARRRARPGWGRIIGAVLAVLTMAAACGPVPRAFEREPANPLTDPLSSPGGGFGLRVDEVADTAGPLGRILAQAVADTLAARDMATTTRPGAKARWVLAGRVAALGRGHPAAWLRWSLTDTRDGTEHVVDQPVMASRPQWDFGDPTVVATIAAETAEDILVLLEVGAEGEDDGAAAGPPPRLRLRLDPVAGAPADGNRALGRAIATALRASGIEITADGSAPFRLAGTVALAAPEPATPAEQRVTITWTVSTADGHDVGTAMQANTVPAGALDRPWGTLAGHIAAAAVPAIDDLLRTATAGPVPGLGPRSPLRAPPPSRDLPPVPGRAPPPATD